MTTSGNRSLSQRVPRMTRLLLIILENFGMRRGSYNNQPEFVEAL
jgi:hypothetical protein